MVKNALSGGQERENRADGSHSMPNNIFSQEVTMCESFFLFLFVQLLVT